ncbi:unnamed protein product [Oikopleura dioica]|uniref:Transgelin n=1 Tax=Oikopleura dioica TaxID=34765 RepID=E4XQV3_OIKDI|nr:unnamed protein product [Oikopleura dioica]CBY33580.1 unnamed protein product [Oikopleura dioica]
MTTRPQGYGLSRELAEKNAAKYSVDDEVEIVQWICDVTGVAAPAAQGPDGFRDFLRSGVVLCTLMNALKEGSCRKPHDTSKTKLAALRQNKENENISFFLTAAEAYGCNKGDLFQTVDLVDGTNLAQVQSTLYKVGGQAQKQGYAGATIGIKQGSENKREFSDEQLKSGQNIIGLQMGSNQVASQKGMSAYGATRQIVNNQQ